MEKRKIYLIGIGMGADGTLTQKAAACIQKSAVLAGAKRMMEPFLEQAQVQGKQVLVSYQSEEIGVFFREHVKDGASGAVLLSGDVGFSSGAKKLMEELQDFQVELVPGISSLVYFCSKLGISWENVCVASAHGKHTNMIQRIQRNEFCFFLMDGQKSLQELCEKLMYYGMDDVVLSVGENLSYASERIFRGFPKEVKEQLRVDSADLQHKNLAVPWLLLVVIAENRQAKDWTALSIPDEAFLRTKVPMTKCEVRNVSIGKLHLTPDAVVYDIGAGSGSVSVEMALQAPDIKVYAIEKNKEALELLEKNKQKFAADNMEIVAGAASAVLEDLPAPTHVFLGGSAGEIEEILCTVFTKNPSCRVVANTISLNSLTQLMNIFEKHKEYAFDIVQMQTSVAKKAGAYQLMMGQNPIYIVTIWKEEPHETEDT